MIVDDVETTPTLDRVINGFTELLDEADSETIAEEYRIGIFPENYDTYDGMRSESTSEHFSSEGRQRRRRAKTII